MQKEYTKAADLSNEMQFYARIGAALFPIPAGTKEPFGIINSFAKEWSRDPAQWEAWRAANPGCNWGVISGPSEIVIADVDVSEVGRDRAWQLWCEWWQSNNLPVPLPHVQSARGGWHFLFWLPEGFDISTLRQVALIGPRDGSRKAIVDLRVGNGFTVAAGSYYDGTAKGEASGSYVLLSDADPYEAPDALIQFCMRKERSAASPAVGSRDPGDVAALIRWLAERDAFSEYGVWVSLGMALKVEFGDAGLDLWRLATYSEAQDDVPGKWESFATEPTGNSVTLNTFLKRAHSMGWRGNVGKSAATMFSGVPLVSSPSIVPIFGGRGEKQSELWSPILATVPTLDRTSAHPEMPDTGHPLRDAVNAAIPSIVANPAAHVGALAVIEAVHPQTAALVAAVTPAVKARAEALRQDAEHALIPSDFIRDHKGEIQRDNPDNVRFFLASLGVSVRYNEWIERVEVRGWEWRDWTALDDTLVVRLRMRAGQTGTRFLPGKEFMWDALLSLAHDSHVDPARDLLDQLQAQWDGQARLSLWLSQACDVPADAYHQAVSASILLGLVARIRCPGIKFDLMPVFISEAQGTSKSTLARLLALRDEWFVENVALGESAKELVLLLAGKSVAEISEMRTRGEVDAVKAMISATHDEGRPAYGRATVKRPRRHIFIGTTNRPEFLEDQTGGRRFLPIRVQGEINLEWVRSNLCQLIGEAATLQARGVDINLPREVWRTAAAHQEAATAKATAEILLTDWFAGTDPCWIAPANLVLLLRHALGRTPTRGEYATTMGRLGFVSRTRWDGEGSPRVWVRGNPSTRTPGYGPSLTQDGRPRLQVAALLDVPQPGMTPLPSG